jgi:hypothetical protein
VTDTDATWIREQANKVRAARQVKPIRFRTTEKCPRCDAVEEHTDDCPPVKDAAMTEPVFCEAAAEWDHDWRVVGGNSDDGTEVVECTECKVRA